MIANTVLQPDFITGCLHFSHKREKKGRNQICIAHSIIIVIIIIIIKIYLLQVGCQPVAVVNLNLNYVKPTKFKKGGLHEKHAVATWKHGSNLSIYL
jgi:hypothetical protein